MSEAGVAAPFERLPWLTDEPQARASARRRQPMWLLWLPAGLLALLVIAGAAYWLGTRSAPVDQPRSTVAESNRSPVTVSLPAPVALPPQPEVRIEPIPQVEPVPAPAPVVTREAAQRPTINASRDHAHPVSSTVVEQPQPATATETSTAAKTEPVASKPAGPLPIWPVRIETQSAGRLVRVGTFANRTDAKRGWTKIMRFYPGMKRLPAMAVPISAVPSGRQYYRLQMGTTSQAHSEVLCQRMRIIGVSCVVLDISRTLR